MTARAERGSPRDAAVVTRDEDPDSGRLGQALRASGIKTLHWPVTSLLPPEDPSGLRALASSAASGGGGSTEADWLVFTSRRGVDALSAALDRRSLRWPRRWRVAVVGGKTASAVEEAGGSVTLTSEGTGEDLARALLAELGSSPAHIVFPTTPRAADTLPDLLEEAGHRVDRIEAYRTELAALDEAECREVIEGGSVGVVTFTSPSAVQGLEDALPSGLLRRLRDQAVAVVIGPTTGSAAAAAGWRCHEAPTTRLEAVAVETRTLLGFVPGAHD